MLDSGVNSREELTMVTWPGNAACGGEPWGAGGFHSRERARCIIYMCDLCVFMLFVVNVTSGWYVYDHVTVN